MSKKKKMVLCNEPIREIPYEIPMYTFEEGKLAGRTVRQVIRRGLDGVQDIADHLISTDGGTKFACSTCIVKELGKQADWLYEKYQDQSRRLSFALMAIIDQIPWYVPLHHLYAKQEGYASIYDVVYEQDEEQFAYLANMLLCALKENLIIADPFDDPETLNHLSDVCQALYESEHGDVIDDDGTADASEEDLE